ncbi:MAG: hypothetical protein ACFCUS_14490 [Rubrimonas sp.]
MVELWPFAASGEIVETLEWRTDVLQTRAAEQRIALRLRPRVILTLRHRLDGPGLARAAALARAGFAEQWHVPLWHHAARPAVTLGSGDVAIALAATEDFAGAEHAALAVDGGEAALVALAAIEPDRLVLAERLGAALPAASVAAARIAVAPVCRGVFAAALDIARRRQGNATATATFLLPDSPGLPSPDLPDAETPTWLGRPVLVDPSVIRQPLATTLRQAVEYVDNGFGPVVVEPLRDLVARGETITLRAHGPAARARLRRWLLDLRGRQASLWLPSWGRELRLTAPMSAGATLMRVEPLGAAEDWAGRSIVIETPGGLVFRSVTAAITEAGEHLLSLSASVGEPLGVETPVHLMTLVRSDADRIELRHDAVACEVALPVVEAPA